MSVVAATPAKAGAAEHVGCIASIALLADNLALFNFLANIDAVQAMEQGDLVNLIFDNKGWVADFIFKECGYLAGNRRFDLRPGAGGQVYGHVPVRRAVRSLGQDKTVIGVDDRGGRRLW